MYFAAALFGSRTFCFFANFSGSIGACFFAPVFHGLLYTATFPFLL